ncbi:MAG: DUF4268 domain-containing protein [Ruminococcus sp.]|jgi:hypothetical protein|nr:DUF4268 domain-containing protein [Ruminococcus sp.]
MGISLGKLEKIDDLRSVWSNEATDFTVWLSEDENLSLLGDTLGLDIEFIGREEAAGAFSIDILAEEAGTGRKIIIENQLEATNHDHLGKIITYASVKNAETIVWIVKKARDEHRQAIEWLNEKTDENIGFYLLEIELWKIGDSKIAPKFSIIVAPNDWVKVNKNQNLNDNPLNQFRLEYWEAFRRFAENHSKLISSSRMKPRPQNWYDISVGTSKCYISLNISIQKKALRAAIYFSKKNKEEFLRFQSYKNEIEGCFNDKLEWSTKKDSIIQLRKEANIENRDDWESQFQWFCESCSKLKMIIDKYKE